MKYLHVSTKVETRIQDLGKSDKTGKAVAQKAKGIIECLASGNIRHYMDAIGNYTHYGENRIKNCRKFDLGSGYRMITLQRGAKIYIPLLGTHDECQRWLENNSRMKRAPVRSGTLLWISSPRQSSDDQAGGDPANCVGDAEADCLPNLSDEDLRRVFCGLVEGARTKCGGRKPE